MVNWWQVVVRMGPLAFVTLRMGDQRPYWRATPEPSGAWHSLPKVAGWLAVAATAQALMQIPSEDGQTTAGPTAASAALRLLHRWHRIQRPGCRVQALRRPANLLTR